MNNFNSGDGEDPWTPTDPEDPILKTMGISSVARRILIFQRHSHKIYSFPRPTDPEDPRDPQDPIDIEDPDVPLAEPDVDEPDIEIEDPDVPVL